MLTSIFTPGSHSYRFHLKSTNSTSNTWELGTITLTIDYTPPVPPVSNPGTITLNKASMLAGETVGISLSAADAGVYRSIRAYWGAALIANIIVGTGNGASNYTYTFPLEDCDLMPSATSGTLTILMESSLSISVSKTVTINVPADVLPTLTDVSAAIITNGLAVAGYVQGYSGVDVAINGAEGALGSTIAAYKITGGGLNVSAGAAQIDPLMSAGDITFTGEITDSRGRKASGTATISVMAYTAPVFVAPDAYRSDDLGAKNQKGTYARLFSGVSYSSLDSQNSVTLKGRVYPKGGAVPAYTSMTPDTPWIAGAGLLLVTKTYIAQMLVEDLISARIIEYIIPTKKTGISIMAGMQGIAFGKSVEIPGVTESAWPIVAPNFYPVGSIYISYTETSPATLFGGTWSALSTGKFLRTGTGGTTGGSDAHVHSTTAVALTQAQLPAVPRIPYGVVPYIYSGTLNGYDATVGFGAYNPASTGTVNHNIAGNLGSGDTHGHGDTGSASNVPAYYEVYAWRRTA